MFEFTKLQWLMVLVPALPLASAVLTAVLGPKLLRQASHVPTIAALATSFVLSIALLFEVQSRAPESKGIGWEETVTLWTWANVPEALHLGADRGYDFSIDVTLRIDPLTSMMLSMVTCIASLVAIYAAGYMHGDRGCWRFFSYVSLFVFSMTMLVSVSNFAMLYVFWEAVGVCSYLLIGFWYEKPEAAAAGKKAFLVNRIGDFGFALALFLIWTTYGTLNFHDTNIPGVLGQQALANPDYYVGGHLGLAICVLLMLGACGKSAQFPLHVWLPDAMEGPTPVSALIHAATMVTAGVYMVTRCTPLFAVSEEARLVVASIGAFTALMAGIIAFTQTDLKRVLAYSTISQLGYMFLALGTGSRAGIIAGMFHLFTHAFFKALLFLGAGSVMHAMGGVIDMERFGGLRRLMPRTWWTFLFGCLALAGVIPFAGFWSKDAIVAAVHESAHHQPVFEWLYYAALVTAFLTSMYTFRAFFLTFYGPERIPAEAGHHAHESPDSMTVPLMILAICALFVGLPYVGFSHERIAHFLERTPSLWLAPGEAYEGLHTDVAVMTTIIALAGVALAAYFYLGDKRHITQLTRLVKPIYKLSYGKFFFDPLYTLLVVWPLRWLAALAYWVDRKIIDGLVNLVGRIPGAVGALLRSMQVGLVQYYAMLMVLGVLVLVGSCIALAKGNLF